MDDGTIGLGKKTPPMGKRLLALRKPNSKRNADRVLISRARGWNPSRMERKCLCRIVELASQHIKG